MKCKNLSRRELLRSGTLSVLGLALAACAQPTAPAAAPPAPTAAASPPAPTAAPATQQRKLIAYFGGWTPTDNMVRSEENPSPHNKILEVVDGYKANHPGVQIEWIRVPSGQQERQWQIAQQTAGTVPHLLPAAQWLIKEDLAKDWWVKLSPYLQQPNPYVKAGEPGSKAWLDQFYPVPTSMLLLDKDYYNVCFGINTTWMFYNVDLFKKLGLKVPTNFKEFLANCQVAKDAGLIGYDFRTLRVSDSDAWYRTQLGQMIMARDIGPKINPTRGAVSFDAVACALKSGVYSASLPQFRQWLELWKQTVPYRRADWPIQSKDENRLFLMKKAIVLEQGSWMIPQLQADRMMDFEWGTFWAPSLTKESSSYVTDPPTAAPNVGTATDNYAISTRARKDGVLDLTVDFMRWMSTPENVQKVLGEISANMPNVKNVPVVDRFKDAFKWVVESIGYVEMFAYETCTMDQAAAEACGKAWRAYLLDQLTIDQCIDENNKAFKGYVERYEKGHSDLKC